MNMEKKKQSTKADEYWEERSRLCQSRVREIAETPAVPEKYRDYFQKQAEFICRAWHMAGLVQKGEYRKLPLQELEQWNHTLYAFVEPERYETAYENPAYAVKQFGTQEGRLFSALSAAMYEMIFAAAEQKQELLTMLTELFIEINCRYEEYDESAYRAARASYKSFLTDSLSYRVEDALAEAYDPNRTFARDILMSDTSSLEYLYWYGEYITENERKVAEYLNRLPKEQIRAMADTYVDGYLRGFETMGIRLQENGIVLLRYPIGFERMMAFAVERLERRGLRVTAKRTGLRARVGRKAGYSATTLNPQFEYDHRQDAALYADRMFIQKELQAYRKAYEKYRQEVSGYLGPACVETFGYPHFLPVNKKEALHFDKRQTKLDLELRSALGELTYRYIKGDQTSFTIIAYPVPSIGSRFEEIFAETVRCNTLDNEKYTVIQQKLIDELDTGYACHIRGTNGNETDLTVMLAELRHPEKETIFENCTADVNIPVGEVFTSPKLTGTNGLLHVSRVFLNGYEYRQLKIVFENGKTTRVTCENFATEEENQAFLAENLLKHHPSLPLGEFAIGTNTTAFVMGEKFQIADRLPILIAEKTGPHFAIGDTCYAHSEDHRVFNRDGKEIIARENEISALWDTEPAKAYFNCHTDITIPYGEIGEIASLKRDGSRRALLKNGRFVLPGTECLNQPLEEWEK